ncbi:MAG TPA: hypothetical protein VFW40_00195 [Capsulimonadaceae bacterium]|nr:hypothetical protein [Capsulimonadaceae bacterium]
MNARQFAGLLVLVLVIGTGIVIQNWYYQHQSSRNIALSISRLNNISKQVDDIGAANQIISDENLQSCLESDNLSLEIENSSNYNPRVMQWDSSILNEESLCAKDDTQIGNILLSESRPIQK